MFSSKLVPKPEAHVRESAEKFQKIIVSGRFGRCSVIVINSHQVAPNEHQLEPERHEKEKEMRDFIGKERLQ